MSLMIAALLAAQADTKTLLKDAEGGGHWIYDDFDAAVRIAKKESKPLFVVFR